MTSVVPVASDLQGLLTPLIQHPRGHPGSLHDYRVNCIRQLHSERKTSSSNSTYYKILDMNSMNVDKSLLCKCAAVRAAQRWLNPGKRLSSLTSATSLFLRTWARN